MPGHYRHHCYFSLASPATEEAGEDIKGAADFIVRLFADAVPGPSWDH
jgi:hypothetical protein